jgi:hypothetical protein
MGEYCGGVIGVRGEMGKRGVMGMEEGVMKRIWEGEVGEENSRVD